MSYRHSIDTSNVLITQIVFKLQMASLPDSDANGVMHITILLISSEFFKPSTQLFEWSKDCTNCANFQHTG